MDNIQNINFLIDDVVLKKEVYETDVTDTISSIEKHIDTFISTHNSRPKLYVPSNTYSYNKV